MNAYALREAWEEAVGPAIAALAQPDTLTDGVLRVRCVPAWLAPLSQRAARVLGELRPHAGDVERVEFVADPAVVEPDFSAPDFWWGH